MRMERCEPTPIRATEHDNKREAQTRVPPGDVTTVDSVSVIWCRSRVNPRSDAASPASITTDLWLWVPGSLAEPVIGPAEGPDPVARALERPPSAECTCQECPCGFSPTETKATKI